VVKHGYDGIEGLDYEHLWTAADSRRPYVALVKAVAASAARAAQAPDGWRCRRWDADHKDAAYDYIQFQDDVRRPAPHGLRLHYMGGDHLGPIAPKGWVKRRP